MKIRRNKVRRIDLSFDEFIAGTIALSDVEMGIFWRACLLIYSAGGRVHKDVLRRCCTSDPRVYKRVIAGLLQSGKLTEDGAYFVNSRCVVELEFAKRRSAVGAENVSKRWSKYRKNNERSDTTVILGGKANHQPSTINHQRKEKKDSCSSAVADGDFEAWWKEVPRKVGKGQARKAHKLALKKAAPEVLLAGIKAYAATRSSEDERYTAHPATWLAGERWLDEDVTAPRAGDTRTDEEQAESRRAALRRVREDLLKNMGQSDAVSEPGPFPVDEDATSRDGLWRLH